VRLCQERCCLARRDIKRAQLQQTRNLPPHVELDSTLSSWSVTARVEDHLQPRGAGRAPGAVPLKYAGNWSAAPQRSAKRGLDFRGRDPPILIGVGHVEAWCRAGGELAAADASVPVGVIHAAHLCELAALPAVPQETREIRSAELAVGIAIETRPFSVAVCYQFGARHRLSLLASASCIGAMAWLPSRSRADRGDAGFAAAGTANGMTAARTRRRTLRPNVMRLLP